MNIVDEVDYQYDVGSATVNALKEQVGGNHYSKLAIQPVKC